MSDRRKSTRPDPEPPRNRQRRPRTPAPLPVQDRQCPMHATGGSRGRARTIPPDQCGGMPDMLTGYRSADAVLRATYRVAIRESEARQLEQLADQLAEAEDALPVAYLRYIRAAAVDLMNVAAFLDYWADQGGDGVDRHEIPVAALVLEVGPEVARFAERLMGPSRPPRRSPFPASSPSFPGAAAIPPPRSEAALALDRAVYTGVNSPVSREEDLVAARGHALTVIWATDQRGRAPAKEFYDGLATEDQAKVLALFRRLAEVGRIRSRENFKRLGKKAKKKGSELWEIKKFQVRLLGDFRPGKVFVVAHGVLKKRDDHSSVDIDKAVRVLDDHDRQQESS